MRFSKIMGIIFCVLGVLGFLGIVLTFDYGYYNRIKDLTLTYSNEIAIMQQELITTWAIGVTVLLFNLAIGVLLLTLDRILDELVRIREGENRLSSQSISSE